MSTVQITFRSMPDSVTVEYLINKYFKKLKRQYQRIGNARAVISLAHKHKHKGKDYSVSLEATVAGRTVICKKKNQNLFVAIRDVFKALEKMLQKQITRKMAALSEQPLFPEDIRPDPSVAA